MAAAKVESAAAKVELAQFAAAKANSCRLELENASLKKGDRSPVDDNSSILAEIIEEKQKIRKYLTKQARSSS